MPSHTMRPEVGSIIRLTIRSVVVFPQPEGPTITVILSDGTWRLRSTTAAVPSRNVLPTDSNSIMPATASRHLVQPGLPPHSAVAPGPSTLCPEGRLRP